MIDTKQLGVYEDTYSVVGGIVDLARHGHPGLALLILVFSILFPVAKLVALVLVWGRDMTNRATDRLLRQLEALGRWSMLDVFVVVLLVGTLNLGLPSGASARPGIYVFAAAILLSMVTTHLSIRALCEAPSEEKETGASSPIVPVVGAVALVLLGGGLYLPLMKVEKWVFWDRDYSILGGVGELLIEGEILLALVVVAFVILTPVLWLLAVLVAWGAGRRGAVGRAQALTHALEPWLMADVFALAFFVVFRKLGGLVVIDPRPGLWLFGAAVLTSLLVARLRRRPSA